MAKLRKLRQWHKSGDRSQLTAGSPLIICPSTGEVISKRMKQVCMLFKKEYNIDVRVYVRGGSKIANLVQPGPLKLYKWGRRGLQ